MGPATTVWRGHLLGADHVVAGNLLADGGTLHAMSAGFIGAGGASLAERLLSAGAGAGGDRRGTRSAALIVATTEPYPDLDLRVDDHDQPVEQRLPFAEGLPTRADPAGSVDREVLANGTDETVPPPSPCPG